MSSIANENNSKNEKRLYLRVLFCPFMFYCGLVLIRDYWIALGFVFIINCVLREQYLRCIPILLLMAYLRIGAIFELAILVLVLFIIVNRKKIKSKHIFLFLGGITVGGIVFYSYRNTILSYLSNFTGLFREDPYENSAALLSTLRKVNPIVGIPLMGLIYFLMPTFNPAGFFSGDVFSIRDTYYMFFGLLNLIYIRQFINAVFTARKQNKTIWFCCLSYILMMFLLPVISGVGRHKVGFVFLYYIACSYGIDNYTKESKLIGNIVSCVLAIWYLYNTITWILSLF